MKLAYINIRELIIWKTTKQWIAKKSVLAM